jgi:hypothetical protein
MKLKFGAIIVDGRGKIGGHVVSKNRGGAYMRTKVTPSNPQSIRQINARNRLTDAVFLWKAIEVTVKEAWNAAVGMFAKTDIFGDTRNPSGFNLFQKLNNNLLLISEETIEDPPLPAAVHNFGSLSVTCVTGTPAMTIAFADAIPDTCKCVVMATPPMSTGKFYVKSEYRVIGVVDDSFTTGGSIKALYDAVFGAPAVNGMKINIKLKCINITTGQAGGEIAAYTVTATS